MPLSSLSPPREAVPDGGKHAGSDAHRMLLGSRSTCRTRCTQNAAAAAHDQHAGLNAHRMLLLLTINMQDQMHTGCGCSKAIRLPYVTTEASDLESSTASPNSGPGLINLIALDFPKKPADPGTAQRPQVLYVTPRLITVKGPMLPTGEGYLLAFI